MATGGFSGKIGSDPVLRAFLEAPLDDDPLTPEGERAVREAENEIARGEGIPWEDALQLLETLRGNGTGNRWG